MAELWAGDIQEREDHEGLNDNHDCRTGLYVKSCEDIQIDGTMDNLTNFGKVQVSIGYDSAATSIVLAGGHGAKLPDPPFNLVWWNTTDFGDPSDDPYKEIVRCTGKVSDTLTVVRAQEDTTATVKNVSGKTYKMILAPTKKMFDDVATEAQSGAQSKVDTHAALTATHGVTKIAGLESDGSINLTTASKSQLKVASTGMSGSLLAYVNGPVDVFDIGVNCVFDGTNWNRIDIAKQAWRVDIISSIIPAPHLQGQRIYGASAGANPISSWDLADGIPIMKTHRDEDVSTSVHPNANTHIIATAPHSGHEVLTSKNASNGYAGLSSGKLADSQMPGIFNKYQIGDSIIQSNDAEAYTSSWNSVKVREITINTLYKSPNTLRISFDLKRAGPGVGNAHGSIYKNGVYQAGSYTGSSSYVTFTHDISFSQGDTIELHIYNAIGGTEYAYIRNFRVKGASVGISLAEAIVDGNVGLATPFAFTNTL